MSIEKKSSYRNTIVIIPCYNEAEGIFHIYNELRKVCMDVSVLVINDGSTDYTREVLETNNIPHINLPVNMGGELAIRAGIKHAIENNFDHTIIYHADGSHDCKFIYEMINKLNNGSDIVIGSRYLNTKVNKPKSVSWLSFINRLVTRKKITDPVTEFRGFGKQYMKDYVLYMNKDFEADLITYSLINGYSVAEIQVINRKRQYGLSSTGKSRVRSFTSLYSQTLNILFFQRFRTKVEKIKFQKLTKKGK